MPTGVGGWDTGISFGNKYWRRSLLSVEDRAIDNAEGFLLVLVLRMEMIRSGGTEKRCRSAFSLHVSLTRKTLLVIGFSG